MDTAWVAELKLALTAHHGYTPGHLEVIGRRRRTTYDLTYCPVTVTPDLMGELKAIPGLRPVPW